MKFESTWQVTEFFDLRKKISNPILIAGMPGIGNVGKISMDMLVEETKAVPVVSFFSYEMPNSVFVNENNIVELPKIVLYHKKIDGKDFLFLTGDVQPTTERSCYEFCDILLDLVSKCGLKNKANLKSQSVGARKINNDRFHILTLGGIGLNEIPEKPKVYITGNDKKFVDIVSDKMKKSKISHETKIYGMVGPIIGVSGILLGLSRERNIPAYSLLAETYGHPIYVGLKGSKSILEIINKYYDLGINLKRLDKEILQIDTLIEKNSDVPMKYRVQETNYIG
ncbi:MAG: PAC2 family protein [Candidatus Woesearchaeota archaeon]